MLDLYFTILVCYAVFLLIPDVIGDVEESCKTLCRYTDYARDIECTSRNLSAIPSGCGEALTLDISYNSLNTLPASAFQYLRRLKYLYLQENEITTIDEGALLPFRLNLQLLNLSRNQIHSISNYTFVNMTKLKYLILSDNEMVTINVVAFQGMTRLIKIFLHNNNLISLQITTFASMPNLLELHLQGNRFHRFDIGLIQHLDNLRKLFVHNNNINEILDSSQTPHTHLEILNLSLNNIVIFNCTAIRSLINLQSIYVTNNTLTGFNDCSYQDFSRMKLSNNSLHCNCQLQPYSRWLRDNYNLSSPTCQSPESERGKEVRNANFWDCNEEGTPQSPPLLGAPVLPGIVRDVAITAELKSISPLQNKESTTTTDQRSIHHVKGDPQNDMMQHSNNIPRDSNSNLDEMLLTFIIIGLVIFICLLLIGTLLFLKRKRIFSPASIKQPIDDTHGNHDYEDISAGIGPPPISRLTSTDTESSEAPMLIPASPTSLTQSFTSDTFSESRLHYDPDSGITSCKACMLNTPNTQQSCYENGIPPMPSLTNWSQTMPLPPREGPVAFHIVQTHALIPASGGLTFQYAPCNANSGHHMSLPQHCRAPTTHYISHETMQTQRLGLHV